METPLAAALKSRTTATISHDRDEPLARRGFAPGNLHEVSRKVSASARAPDAALRKKFGLTQNPKPDSVFSDRRFPTPVSDLPQHRTEERAEERFVSFRSEPWDPRAVFGPRLNHYASRNYSACDLPCSA